MSNNEKVAAEPVYHCQLKAIRDAVSAALAVRSGRKLVCGDSANQAVGTGRASGDFFLRCKMTAFRGCCCDSVGPRICHTLVVRL